MNQEIEDFWNILANTCAFLDVEHSISINCKLIRVAVLDHHHPISQDEQSRFASCHQTSGFV